MSTQAASAGIDTASTESETRESPKLQGVPRHLEGYVHKHFRPVARALREMIAKEPGGAAAAVYHRGELVCDVWGGVRDNAGNPWEKDTASVSFSTTKGVTSTALHILAGRGLVDYEAPVCRYWPEFGANGKEDITVRHALCHQAGLYNIREMV